MNGRAWTADGDETLRITEIRLRPTRMNYGRRLDGNPAVGLGIFKERSANLVEVSRAQGEAGTGAGNIVRNACRAAG
jgi:hypothetical protein